MASATLALAIAARVAPVVLLAPILAGRRGIRVKLAVTVALGAGLIAMLEDPGQESGPAASALTGPIVDPAAPTIAAALAVVARELVVGAALGFTAALPVYAARGAGLLVARSRADGPGSGPGEPSLATFFTLLAIVMFVGVDGHLALLRALAESYRILPIAPPGAASPVPGAGAPDVAAAIAAGAVAHLVASTGRVIEVGVVVAAPVVAAALLCDLAAGVAERALAGARVGDAARAARALCCDAVLLLALWTWAGFLASGGDSPGRAVELAARALSP